MKGGEKGDKRGEWIENENKGIINVANNETLLHTEKKIDRKRNVIMNRRMTSRKMKGG